MKEKQKQEQEQEGIHAKPLSSRRLTPRRKEFLSCGFAVFFAPLREAEFCAIA